MNLGEPSSSGTDPQWYRVAQHVMKFGSPSELAYVLVRPIANDEVFGVTPRPEFDSEITADDRRFLRSLRIACDGEEVAS